MKATAAFELPEELKPSLQKARRLEWITVGYLVTVAITMYLVSGNSQAMKAAWLEDALSLLPSLSFLVASAIYDKQPTKRFPYGYHKAFTIAFLCGSVALFAIGCFLLIDSSITLLKQEHASIGAFALGGQVLWLGYLMYAALLYSAIPAMILGRKKLPLADKLHNKVLHTSASTQKADWMTALAAVVGITGIGFGWWWADAVAAIFISFSVLRDGFGSLRNAARDLMDRQPQTADQKQPDPLLKEVDEYLKKQPWIKKAAFRFREDGQVYFGEVFVVPASGEPILDRLEELEAALQSIHWKIHEVTIMPVKELPGTPPPRNASPPPSA